MGYRRIVAPAWLNVLFVALLLGACQQLISDYSIDAYKNATSLKAETLALIDKSGDRYSKHKSEVEALTTKINAAYEFAAGLPNNQLSATQWQIMRDPNRDLYGGFVKVWSTQGKVSPDYRAAKKEQIADAYNQIICLEVNKKDSKSCKAAVTAVSQ